MLKFLGAWILLIPNFENFFEWEKVPHLLHLVVKMRKDVRIVMNEWPMIDDNFCNSILLQRLKLDHRIEKQREKIIHGARLDHA